MCTPLQQVMLWRWPDASMRPPCKAKDIDYSGIEDPTTGIAPLDLHWQAQNEPRTAWSTVYAFSRGSALLTEAPQVPDLSSVKKPRQTRSRFESAGAQPRKTRCGDAGKSVDEQSRAAKQLIVHGKREEPLQRSIVGTGSTLESVIGADERVRILETDLPPWRMICALRMRGSTGGAAIGTGWFVGPRTIVTAGHCVYSNHFFGGWADVIEVTPGRNGDDAPFGRFTSTRMSTVSAWANDENPDFDYGAIHLDEPVGDTTGWFGIGALPADELAEHMINVSGYPGDRGNGREQYFHANRILRVTDRRIFYDVDTFGGQSGAPAWIQPSDSEVPMAVGIHAYGVGGTPTSFGLTANSAPRITADVLQVIEAWVEESGGTD